ncbi:hypothetical protein LJ737_15500 [Hymenobacter sp. 15J16-1T3B]|uniref:hypothetical protein n=1 Tax=Hymenobacter sp. 15J16-1T3B TaxID=2886941 RepID=UPI001D10353A|nr:hypothetical protein [Hymenobacter sp. 15J16-1T3B]MCC3158652.1 hypothetical protein [Hymenobacter sp. 15J16-1T3B]
MKHLGRVCPYCGEPVEGRPNKIFCSDYCKGRHFREVGPATVSESPSNRWEPNPISDHQPVQPSSPIPAAKEDYWQRTVREEQERKQKQKADAERALSESLHNQFSDVVRDFLDAEGKLISLPAIEPFLVEVQELCKAYCLHPYLKQSDNQAKRRLKELYSIEDTLLDLVQHISEKSIWQSKHERYFLTDKKRKALRELLIAD